MPTSSRTCLLSFCPSLLSSCILGYSLADVTQNKGVTNMRILSRMTLSLVFLLATITAMAHGQNDTFGLAVDFSGLATKQDYLMLRGANYDVTFVRVYQPDFLGAVDSNGCLNIRIGADVNMKMEVYITPPKVSTRGKDATAILDEIMTAMTGCSVDLRRVWLQVVNPAYWSKTTAMNVGFIQGFLDYYANNVALYPKTSVGIYTNSIDWKNITGDSDAFSTAVVQLWYSDVTQGGVDGESVANLDDAVNFGGWTKADVKQYAHNEGLTGLSIQPLNRNIYRKQSDDDTLSFSRYRPQSKGKNSARYVVGGHIKHQK